MDNNKVLYLSKKDVGMVELDMLTIIQLLEKAFLEKNFKRTEMPPKIGIHTQPDAFLHAMPAFIPAMGSAGIKWVGAYPENSKQKLPYISGLLILNNTETGIPYVIMDCTWITAYRTGGATALAARYLARPDSQVAGILACGFEGRTNLIALATQFPIKRVYAYDILPEAQSRYVKEMSDLLNIEVIGVTEPRKAVVESDIVVTSGPIMKHPNPTIEKEWLHPGLFASSVDFGSYWMQDCLQQFDKMSTDDLAQYQYYKSIGYFDDFPEPYADLGQLISGTCQGRTGPNDRTIAVNLGLALSDLAIAPTIYNKAVSHGLGTLLSL